MSEKKRRGQIRENLGRRKTHSDRVVRGMRAGHSPQAPAIYGNLDKIIVFATRLYVDPPTSAIHKARVRGNCERMKSDYRYSAKLIYNNFPWPESVTDEQRAKVEECVQGILDARQPHLVNGTTLADFYDPSKSLTAPRRRRRWSFLSPPLR